jgi:hypothetical protein
MDYHTSSKCDCRCLPLTKSFENCYTVIRGKIMAIKVKTVQPTEIKDKKIAREIIEQIHKPIPASVMKRHKKQAVYFSQFYK